MTNCIKEALIYFEGLEYFLVFLLLEGCGGGKDIFCVMS